MPSKKPNAKSLINLNPNKYHPWRDYIVRDFYRDLKKNEDLIDNRYNRVVIIIGKKNNIITHAILNKRPENGMWQYYLEWFPQFTQVIKQVAPFRATKKNKELFNQKTREYAEELIALIEKK